MSELKKCACVGREVSLIYIWKQQNNLPIKLDSELISVYYLTILLIVLFVKVLVEIFTWNTQQNNISLYSYTYLKYSLNVV